MPGDGGTSVGSDGIGCMFDSECTSGVNGRCEYGHQVTVCTYDECTTASDCKAGELCLCGSGSPTRSANTCLPSNCDVDSECGPGGYCSPTYDTSCGPFDGVVGYYCHRLADECTKDECVNDADCANVDGGGGEGYCAWDPSSSRWTCADSVCAG